MLRHRLTLATLAVASQLVAAAHAQVGPTQTVTFQEGVDGYAGQLDKRVGSDGTNQLGSSTPNYFVDGQSTTNSADVQDLIRFDNVFGTGPGQVPVGATILKASLQLTTNSIDPLATPAPGNADAPSAGPWGVARLLRPWTESTVYTDFGALGPAFRNGGQTNVSAGRATGYFDDSIGSDTSRTAVDTDFNNGTMNGDEAFRGNVQPILQRWSDDPTSAHGFTVQAGRTGTTDGWQLGTSSNPDLARRPKLSVSYTTDAVETIAIQQGVNGYAGGVQNWLRQNNNSGATDQLDGGQIDQQFLDGPNATSPDDRTMIRFNDLFASQGGAIADDAEIVDAYLVVTTGSASANARTGGAWAVHQMLVDWDLARDDTALPSVYGDFGGGAGPTVGTDLGEVADTEWGMTADGQAFFDVTQVMKNWQGGAANYGLQVQSSSTDDGWQVRFNGATQLDARPQLVVRTLLPLSRWVADADGNWTDAPNWKDAKVARGAGRIAEFGDAITAARTVTLGEDLTVGTLKFDAVDAYTIAGTSTLALDRASGTAKIDVLRGQHAVRTPVKLNKATAITVAAGAGLTMTGAIDAAGQAVTKAGGGALTVPGLRADALGVTGGSIRVAAANADAATSVFAALAIDAGATFDLSDNAVVIDYAAGAASPLAAITAAAADGRLTSTTGASNFVVGVAEAAALNRTRFGGVDLDGTAVIADLTLAGDSNLDFAVDFADLVVLAQNYAGLDKSYVQGDANYDGAVDFGDLVKLAQNYGGNALAAGQVAVVGASFAADFALAQSMVPEPTSLAMLAAASALVARRRR